MDGNGAQTDDTIPDLEGESVPPDRTVEGSKSTGHRKLSNFTLAVLFTAGSYTAALVVSLLRGTSDGGGAYFWLFMIMGFPLVVLINLFLVPMTLASNNRKSPWILFGVEMLIFAARAFTL